MKVTTELKNLIKNEFANKRAKVKAEIKLNRETAYKAELEKEFYMKDEKVFECETYVIWERVEVLRYLNGDFVLSHPRAKVIEAVIEKEKRPYSYKISLDSR